MSLVRDSIWFKPSTPVVEASEITPTRRLAEGTEKESLTSLKSKGCIAA